MGALQNPYFEAWFGGAGYIQQKVNLSKNWNNY